jgi:elongation factor P
MINTSDFKKGTRIELDGEPWQVVEVSTQAAQGRGGNTIVRTRVRNIRTGVMTDRSFKGGERVKEPDFRFQPAEYLYDENGELFYFMDKETYEQFPLRREDIEYELQFLRPNDEVRALVFNDTCIGVELPHTVILEVTDTAPGFKGDTVNAATKPATLETGLEVQVPLFVEVGQKLVIDTREARYIRRA